MTNREYVMEKFKYKYNHLENLIELLCPYEFDDNLQLLKGCSGECRDCWELEVPMELLKVAL